MTSQERELLGQLRDLQARMEQADEELRRLEAEVAFLRKHENEKLGRLRRDKKLATDRIFEMRGAAEGCPHVGTCPALEALGVAERERLIRKDWPKRQWDSHGVVSNPRMRWGYHVAKGTA